jgi:hypothetical protein
LELASQGNTQRDIADVLKVSPATVNGDLQYMNAIAKAQIKSFIEDRIPLEYAKSLTLLDSIKKQAFDIAAKDSDARVRLQALSLIRDVDASIHNLLTGSHVINQTVAYIESTRLKILQSQADLKSDVAVVTARLDDAAAATEAKAATEDKATETKPTKATTTEKEGIF